MVFRHFLFQFQSFMKIGIWRCGSGSTSRWLGRPKKTRHKTTATQQAACVVHTHSCYTGYRQFLISITQAALLVVLQLFSFVSFWAYPLPSHIRRGARTTPPISLKLWDSNRKYPKFHGEWRCFSDPKFRKKRLESSIFTVFEPFFQPLFSNF